MSKEITSQSLRKVNIFAGILHLAQMVAVLALSNDFALPINATYMTGPPGTTFAEPITLFETPVGLTVGIFLGLSALAHFIVASPQFFPRYSAGIAAKRNYFRWVEYSISSSVMIVLIAQVTGVAEISAIISIFGVNASMILFGWLQEKYENPGSGGWLHRSLFCRRNHLEPDGSGPGGLPPVAGGLSGHGSGDFTVDEWSESFRTDQGALR
jgi:hypothetical protein